MQERKEDKENTKFYNFKKGDLEASKGKKIIFTVIIILLIIGFVYYGYQYYKVNYSHDNKNEATASMENTINLNDYSITGDGININDNVITIKKEGFYTISGTTLNSNIIVDSKGKVTLILSDANIASKTTTAIFGKNCDSLTITLKDNTNNSIEDNSNSDYNAAIFSNSKLIINGNGKLNIVGNVEEGITTKANDLIIENGNINIKSNGDGLNIDGALIINGGNIYINAEGNGIDSNKDVIINGGVIFVMGSSKADDAGIDSENLYKIAGGNVVSVSNGEMEEPSNQSTQKTILFNLDNKIKAGTLTTLLDKDDKVIVSFKSEKDFKALTISTNTIENSTYYLYENGSYTTDNNFGIFDNGVYTKGTAITINNETEFKTNKITNWFGIANIVEDSPR